MERALTVFAGMGLILVRIEPHTIAEVKGTLPLSIKIELPGVDLLFQKQKGEGEEIPKVTKGCRSDVTNVGIGLGLSRWLMEMKMRRVKRGTKKEKGMCVCGCVCVWTTGLRKTEYRVLIVVVVVILFCYRALNGQGQVNKSTK